MSGVRVEDRGEVRWIVFDRPEALNALTRADLRDATRATVEAPGRAIVYTGAGERAMCAGMHVESFQGLSPAEARALISEVGDFVGAARSSPLVTACAVDGYCLGAALELAMGCDLRVTTTRAVFGMPEIRVGIPSVVEAALLQQYVGLAKAQEMLLTGDLWPVAELPGLANAVVAPDRLAAATEELLARVTRHSPAALASQKRLFRTWQDFSLTESIARSIDEFAAVFADPLTARHVDEHVARVRKRS